MIKFIHKRHLNKTSYPGKITIYFSGADIVLGLLLVILVGFFIYNYMANANRPSSSAPVYYGNNPIKALRAQSNIPLPNNRGY